MSSFLVVVYGMGCLFAEERVCRTCGDEISLEETGSEKDIVIDGIFVGEIVIVASSPAC